MQQKNLIKLFLFFIGLALLALIGLEYVGAIRIYCDKLDKAFIIALSDV
jgi:uncharacterized membrane protein (Fun14 family)